MVDIETTGTSPDHAAIIQIAAVRFNYKAQTVDSESMFDRCLWMAPGRYWDEDTRVWWAKQQRHILASIQQRGEDPALVVKEFSEWVGNGKVRMWAKPTTFEFPLLSSYFRQFEVGNPFDFRYCTDLQSFILGRGKTKDEIEAAVPFEGDAHNALYDVLHQIRMVFEALK
jgi:hypothetical protein